MTTIKVVIAEDDPQIAEIQRRFLERIDGYDTIGIAYSIADLRDMVDVFEPALILLDVQFGDGNGIDFLQEMRLNHKETDVILITAAKEVETFQNALRGGAFDYILKPLIFNRLEQALTKFRQYFENTLNLTELNQSNVDRIMSSNDQVQTTRPHPKGIDPLTLDKIRQLLSQDENQLLTAEEVGQQIGSSRTTARRYLEYLLSINEVSADLHYGTVGRPERLYQSI